MTLLADMDPADMRRVADHVRYLANIDGIATVWNGKPTLTLMESRVILIDAGWFDRDWEEFADKAAASLTKAKANLLRMIAEEKALDAAPVAATGMMTRHDLMAEYLKKKGLVLTPEDAVAVAWPHIEKLLKVYARVANDFDLYAGTQDAKAADLWSSSRAEMVPFRAKAETYRDCAGLLRKAIDIVPTP